jgi:hypothetical protein
MLGTLPHQWDIKIPLDYNKKLLVEILLLFPPCSEHEIIMCYFPLFAFFLFSLPCNGHEKIICCVPSFCFVYNILYYFFTRWGAWRTSKTSIMWFIWRWIKIVSIPIVSCILLSPWTQRRKVSNLYLWRTNFFEVSNVQLH